MGRFKFLGAALLAALLLWSPQAAALGAVEAMGHWAASVAPALFPFLALMPLLTCREAAEAYERLLGRATRALFGLPGAAAPAMVMGMVAGSPAGTLAARNIAARGGLNRGQLKRLAVAGAGLSPAFLIGGIGAGMLGSAGIGWRLLLAQALTQLILAFALRGAWRRETEPVEALPRAASDQPVREAVLAVLTVGGYMALFGAMTFAIRVRVGRGVADALLCLLDVPSGARLVANLPMDGGGRAALLGAMCGFGGGCILAQNLSALKGCGVKAGQYVALRALAGAMNAGLVALMERWPEVEMAVGRGKPLAAAGLAACLLAVPVLVKFRKSIS